MESVWALPLINEIMRYKKRKNEERGVGSAKDNIIENCRFASESVVINTLISDHLPEPAVTKENEIGVYG